MPKKDPTKRLSNPRGKPALLTEMPPELKKAAKINTYGVAAQEEALLLPPWLLEARAFHLNPPKGLGRLTHFRNWCQLIWPVQEKHWNPWMDAGFANLWRETDICRYGDQKITTSVWTGCAAVGKTHMSGMAALLWWSLFPAESIVVLTTTSKEMVRKRVWPVIRNLADTMVDRRSGQRLVVPGEIMESKTAIQASKSNDRNAIFAMAVAHGETAKAVAKLQGMHARRMMLVVDECNGTPEAIFNVIPNWRKGCEELVLLFIGNAVSRLDPHGRLCEPRDGWASVGVESEEWATKGVEEWQVPAGQAVHFDGAKSPNVRAGFNKWPFIYRTEDWEQAERLVEKGRGYWSFDRGFWPGEGVADTVLTEGMLVRCKVDEKPPFTTSSKRLAFLDPAFGGDDCELRFADIGPTEDHPEGVVVLGRRQIVDTSPVAGEEMDFSIARRVIEALRAQGVEPENFALDACGTGRGVAAIIATEWSPRILRLETSGNASDEPASLTDDRPGREVYDRVATENWFRVRELVESGQLKGLTDTDSKVQLCSRTYAIKGRRYMLSTKEECKDTLRRSPDQADAVVGVCWLARQKGIIPRGRGNLKVQRRSINVERALEALYDEETAYTVPE